MRRAPGTIVVGVDGSESADSALAWAVDQAVAEHRDLTLVHAGLDLMGADSRGVLQAARAVVHRAPQSLGVHEVLELLDPRESLLRASATATMVVVGSRGRGPARPGLGSVSVSLLRHAHCPVVVLPAARSGTVRNGVLLGLDAAPESRPVLEFAYGQASLHSLPLTVVNCGWGGENDCVAVAGSLAGMGEKYPEVRVTTRLARGAPVPQLLLLAEGMDLVVVGAHQRSRLAQAVLGSVSLAVVEGATCPVAVVPCSAGQPIAQPAARRPVESAA